MKIKIIHTDIGTDACCDGVFCYSRIEDMYKTGPGLGVQCVPEYEGDVIAIMEKMIPLLEELRHVSGKIAASLAGGV